MYNGSHSTAKRAMPTQRRMAHHYHRVEMLVGLTCSACANTSKTHRLVADFEGLRVPATSMGPAPANELTCNIASVMLLTFPKNRKL
jgi:hypothetical protein